MPAYKDKERDTWYASFYFVDWTGVRKIKKKRGFTKKKDAQDFEREFLSKQEQSCDMSFKSLYDLYLEDKRVRLRKNTMGTKESIVDKHIIPYFATIRVNDITPVHIRKWQAVIIGLGFAPTYQRTINNQITSIFNYAVTYYHLSENPCHKAGRMGSKKARKMKIWQQSEFELFIESVKRPSAAVGFQILFWTGIRIGELLALTKDDFDLNRGMLTISKSYQRIEGEDIITPPKTERSNRSLSIPAALCDIINDYYSKIYDYQPGDRLFPFTKYYYWAEKDKACELSGVKKIRTHDLRHSYASMMIDMGVSLLELSERLGHESIQTTVDTYGHLYPQRGSTTTQLTNERMLAGSFASVDTPAPITVTEEDIKIFTADPALDDEEDDDEPA